MPWHRESAEVPTSEGLREVMLSLLIHVAKKEKLVLAEKEQLHVCGVAENHQASSSRLNAIIPNSGSSNVAVTDTAEREVRQAVPHVSYS